MKRYLDDDLEEVGEARASRARGDRFVINVEFRLSAEDIDEAEYAIKELIQQGIMVILDNEGREVIDSYDVLSTEPAEVS